MQKSVCRLKTLAYLCYTITEKQRNKTKRFLKKDFVV